MHVNTDYIYIYTHINSTFCTIELTTVEMAKSKLIAKIIHNWKGEFCEIDMNAHACKVPKGCGVSTLTPVLVSTSPGHCKFVLYIHVHMHGEFEFKNFFETRSYVLPCLSTCSVSKTPWVKISPGAAHFSLSQVILCCLSCINTISTLSNNYY